MKYEKKKITKKYSEDYIIVHMYNYIYIFITDEIKIKSILN